MEQPIDVTCDGIVERSNSADFGPETCESIDPLQGCGADNALVTEPRFYRMNSIVFAEPFKSTSNDENSLKDDEDKDEIVIIDNLIVCKKNGKKYKKYHFNIDDGSPTRCPQPNCHRKFSTAIQLKTHIRRVHCADRKRYICELCGRGFPELHLLRRHADVHSDRTVECNVCGVKLSLRSSLRTHLLSHSNTRSHQCNACKKTFTRASTKVAHVKFVHREGLLECSQCENRFASRKQWSLHMTSHKKKPD